MGILFLKYQISCIYLFNRITKNKYETTTTKKSEIQKNY